jgi:hypothetical protein
MFQNAAKSIQELAGLVLESSHHGKGEMVESGVKGSHLGENLLLGVSDYQLTLE